MARGEGTVYSAFMRDLMYGLHDLPGSDIKLALVHSYTPNTTTHETFADVLAVATELVGTGYTVGGKLLANTSIEQVGGIVYFKAGAVTWTALDAGTPSHAVMYNDSESNDPVIAYWIVDAGTNGGDYTLTWANSRMLKVS